ncbi:MAG TPA: hypothetical protein VGM30_16655 [Puia sp.]|jgi:hypothetical protein
MYDVKPNLIIGFHGCERSVRDQLLMNPNDYKISQKPFDWLGHGLYFWENNYEGALEWATDKKQRGGIKEPAVIGAVLFLGHCCDFLDKRYIKLLASYFDNMKSKYELLGKILPQNKDVRQDTHKDKILRHLDCAAIEFMHSETQDQYKKDLADQGYSEYKIFDSTRGVFTEGGPAFEGAGLFEKSHIQICIRNPNCIQGFFMPRDEIDFVNWLGKKAA